MYLIILPTKTRSNQKWIAKKKKIDQLLIMNLYSWKNIPRMAI